MNQYDRKHYYFPRTCKEAFGSEFYSCHHKADTAVFWVAVFAGLVLILLWG